MNKKTILILGGGVGGIVTANALHRHLASKHRIVVIDKQAEYVFTPSLLWVMVGWRQPKQITKALQRLLTPGIEVVQAEIQTIDPDRNLVYTSEETLAYDYLVLALGADLAPGSMPGFSESAYTPFDLEGATKLWAALQGFQRGRVAVLVSAVPYKCPAAPYETALLLDDHFRRHRSRDQIELVVYTPESAPMGVAGPAMGQAVVEMLETKGIIFNPELNLTHIDPEAKELVFKEGRHESFDFLAGVPPHRPPRAVKESPLANENGWISVDKNTLSTRFENVYAIGDVTAVTLANGKPLPKAGVFAHGEGETVAARIIADIRGEAAQAQFDGVGYCWLETGSGSAAFASGHFYAEPDPLVPLPRSGKLWHWGKVAFEQYWLNEGLRRHSARLGMNLGAKLFGIPASL
ncbi:MAG: NAD(P)/FAD-dependent oxidoreductase [Chloroflexi bacterium]|nr:MAG: NAD(P)/FAD-dependent oxidoreductase [Chloroflexota bacterium]